MGCRKKSYSLEFMYSDFARDFVGVVFMSFFTVPRAPTTTGTVVVLSPYICSTSISKCLYLLSFSVVVTRGFGLEGYSHVNEKAMSFLFFSTMSGLLAAVVLSVWMGMSLRIVTLQYVAQYPDGTSIRTLKTKTQFLRRLFQLSVNEVFRMKAEHFSFKMKVLAS